MGYNTGAKRFSNKYNTKKQMNGIEYKDLIVNLLEGVDGMREENVSAGTKYRLMGLVADIAEVAQGLQEKVLKRVSEEVVLDADAGIDYAELSEAVLAKELAERTDVGEDVREQVHLVNDALGGLNCVLGQIADQLERRHKDEEYAKVYEAEKKRYMSSSTSKRTRKDYEEWKDYACDNCPKQEDIEDYRVEKLVHLFEKGVLKMRVEHIQRAKRYPEEIDFSQLDDDHPLKRTVHKYYHELRKLVNFEEGFLVVDPVRVGRYFYVSRHEQNAKSNRTNFLKYMHKVELAQEEYSHLMARQENEEKVSLPEVLAIGEAMKYWKRLREAGFVDEQFQLSPSTTRKQAMYIADLFSEHLQMQSKWKAFQNLWHINNLAQEKWEMQETGKVPFRSREIENIFRQ